MEIMCCQSNLQSSNFAYGKKRGIKDVALSDS